MLSGLYMCEHYVRCNTLNVCTFQQRVCAACHVQSSTALGPLLLLLLQIEVMSITVHCKNNTVNILIWREGIKELSVQLFLTPDKLE